MYPVLNGCQTIKKQPSMSSLYFIREGKTVTINVNDSASDILALCNGINTINDIKAIIYEKYSEDYEKVSNFIDDFLNTSIDIGTIKFREAKYEMQDSVKVVGSNEYWTPYLISLELTYNCPLSCRHCYLGEKSQEYMYLELAKRICKEASDLGVDVIQLTGGEILTYEWIIELLRYVSNLSTEIQITTSGFINNEKIYDSLELLNNVNGSIQVSLDGLERSHNYIRGNNNSFKKAIHFIKSMIERKVIVNVGTCIINQPIEEVEMLCSMIKEMGVHSMRISPTSERGNAKKNNIVSSVDTCRYVSDIKEHLIKKYNSDSFRVVSVDEYRDKVDSNFKNCGFGYNMLKISPGGKVSPCVVSDMVIGNISNVSLKDFLSNLDFKKLANIEKPNSKYCVSCNKSELCKGCIIEGIMYKNTVKYCKWYDSHKSVLDTIVHMNTPMQ